MTTYANLAGDELHDIREGLPALFFENFIDPGAKQLLHLRKLAHLHTVFHSIHATYFIKLLIAIRSPDFLLCHQTNIYNIYS